MVLYVDKWFFLIDDQKIYTILQTIMYKKKNFRGSKVLFYFFTIYQIVIIVILNIYTKYTSSSFFKILKSISLARV